MLGQVTKYTLILLALIVAIVVVSLGASAAVLYNMRDMVSESVWNEGVIDFLDLQTSPLAITASYDLSSREEQIVEKLNIPPDLLQRATATEVWCKEQFRDDPKKLKSCDRAIYIRLTRSESGNCSNAGTASAAEELRKRGFNNDLAKLRDFFLPMWKKYDIRSDPNSFSSKYIGPDYSLNSVKGSRGAGALGCSQFMPYTAWMNRDVVEPPFDLWNPDTAMHLMAAELARIGWDKTARPDQQIKALWRWNHHKPWITRMVESANEYRQYLGDADGISSLGAVTWSEQINNSWWKNLAYGFLKILGLAPEIDDAEFYRQAEEIYNTNPSQPPAGPTTGRVRSYNLFIGQYLYLPLYSNVLSSDEKDHTNPRRGSVLAWDISAPIGAVVYSPGNGVVQYAGCNNAGGYGCWVIIRLDGGYKAYLCHLANENNRTIVRRMNVPRKDGRVLVRAGQRVTASTPVGHLGRTGITSWPHTHMEIFHGGRIPPSRVFPRSAMRYCKFCTVPPGAYKGPMKGRIVYPANIPSKTSQSTTTPSLPTSNVNGTYSVTYNFGSWRVAPQNDGEKFNVFLWARRNQTIQIAPGQKWNFCTMSDVKNGWRGYRVAAGYIGGGTCYNASMLVSLARKTPGIAVLRAPRHHATPWRKYLHTAIVCPGSPIILQNRTNKTAVITWSRNGQYLTVSVHFK